MFYKGGTPIVYREGVKYVGIGREVGQVGRHCRSMRKEQMWRTDATSELVGRQSPERRHAGVRAEAKLEAEVVDGSEHESVIHVLFFF